MPNPQFFKIETGGAAKEDRVFSGLAQNRFRLVSSAACAAIRDKARLADRSD
jgi:hypothetical protein